MIDRDFDAMLEGDLAELPPPADIVDDITPWRKAITRVLTGLALCTVTLNFLLLNYILPAVGIVLMLLGTRSLRRENGGFRACYILTVFRAVFFFATLISGATIWQSEIFAHPAAYLLSFANLALSFVFILCLRSGFRAVQEKAGLPANTKAAGALIVCFLVMCALALIRYNGLILGLGLVAAYIFTIRGLYRLSGELDEAGYAIEAAAVRVSDRTLVSIIAAVTLLAMAAGYIFLGQYPMEWTDAEPAGQTELADVRSELIGLGFPEEVLADLSDEDVATCQGALRVVVDTIDLPANHGRLVRDQTSVGIHEYRVFDVKELRMTGVAVGLPGERESWRIFHHFRWTVEPAYRGTEALQLWPAYRRYEGWESNRNGEITGRVLCDMDGKTLVSPYHSLNEQTYSQNHPLFGSETTTDVFAAFSFPRRAENCRGYVCYDILENTDGYLIDSWMNYVYQQVPLQYPVKTATEHRMTSTFGNRVFITVQYALQFFADEDEMRAYN